MKVENDINYDRKCNIKVENAIPWYKNNIRVGNIISDTQQVKQNVIMVENATSWSKMQHQGRKI